VSDRIQTLNRRDTLAALAAGALLPLAPGSTAQAETAQRALTVGRAQPFNLGWRFFKGAGEGLEAPGFDDSGWRTVDLPHDWSIEDLPDPTPPSRVGPFDAGAEGKTATGFTVGGEGWYRKRFEVGTLPARAEILFDGVYMNSDVWLNGHFLGNHPYGYTPFAYDLTPYLRAGGENVLAVRVRNLGRNSRWYSGSGIYRPVSLDVFAEPARVARWGVSAWTRRIADGQAEIDVKTSLADAGKGLRLRTRLRSASGEIVATAASVANPNVEQTLRVRNPSLWSPATPTLYTLETELMRGDLVIDRLTQGFGVRIVAFDAQRGMTINGETVRLRGGCVHHDTVMLGAAAYADADERRIRRLRARGFNALRCSHNPPSRSFLEACDRNGMLLVVEAFDAWHRRKLPEDYSRYFSEHWRDDLGTMVLSARNSPSVIMWSIGNEISGRAQAQGLEDCWRLANEARRLDPTRPVTAGVNGFSGRMVIADHDAARPGHAGRPEEASLIFLDVPGYNYKLDEIEHDHARYPDRVIYASEYAPVDAYKYEQLGARAPYMIGGFVWTAMDYLGEAGIGGSIQRARQVNTSGAETGVQIGLASYPWVAAYCGDLDLLGEQKPQSLQRDVIWGLSPIEMAVTRPAMTAPGRLVLAEDLASWTWPGAEGQALTVKVMTSGDRVELKLNGVTVGEKMVTPADGMRVVLQATYAPGVLEAVAYRGATEIGRTRLETAGAPTRLMLTAERSTMRRDRQSLVFVQVKVLDAQGRGSPDAAIPVQLSLQGPAELIGFGSANPLAVGSLQSSRAQTFHGRALAVLRAAGAAGKIRVVASSDGLESDVQMIEVV
jgi:beta-galactosidase